MKEIRLIMGMPVTVDITDAAATDDALEAVFAYLTYVDYKFSTYKTDSEVSRINRAEINADYYSDDMREVVALSNQTKHQTQGYFDILKPDGSIDPSGLVKGWAIHNASKLLRKNNFKDFFIEAGGDIQVDGLERKVGIRNPFNKNEIIKIVYLRNRGIATSGNYERGKHIYNPNAGHLPADEIASLTVIGPDVYEADRFATAAFAMGVNGINFIESVDGCEGYMIGKDGIAVMTSGFEAYTKESC